MTPTQINVVTRIQQYQFHRKPEGSEHKYEVKRFRVEEFSTGRVLVAVTVGLKGDEGTLAGILCRDYGLFIVGPRGGIKACHPMKRCKSKARKYPLIYGWNN